jgi:hypothetical protein
VPVAFVEARFGFTLANETVVAVTAVTVRVPSKRASGVSRATTIVLPTEIV